MKSNAYKGRIVSITGAASGIGRSLCLNLASKGAFVYCTDIDFKGASRVVSKIKQRGGQAVSVKLDVKDFKKTSSHVRNIVSRHGRIDLYFNCAAVSVMGKGSCLDRKYMDAVIHVNLLGAIYGTISAYRIMTGQGYGRIINISSIAGFSPFALNSLYTASKHGICGFTDSLRYEAIQCGVGLHLVCPGMVDTAFYSSMQTVGLDKKAIFNKFPKKLMGPDKAAELILRGVERNRYLIVFPSYAKLFYYLNRFFPWINNIINRKLVKELLKCSNIRGA